MTIRRTALAVVAAGALALTACSNDDQDNGTTETPATTDASAEPQAHEQVLGDTITYTGTDEYPADVDITIDDISASTSCHEGQNDYVDTPEPEGTTYIKVAGEMDVRNTTWHDSYSVLDHEWIALDPDGYQLQIGPAFSCEPTEGQQWDEATQIGNKSRLVQEYAVQGAPDRWVLNPTRSDEVWGWEIPETDTQEEGSDGPAPTPAAAPVEVPTQEAVAPASFECLSIADNYQAGTARYTDGSTGFEQSCVQAATDEWNSSPEKAEHDAWKEEYYSDMSNAERSNYGISAATPNDCDGYLGAHEDPDDSHC